MSVRRIFVEKKPAYAVKAGETVVVNVDFAALHDGSGPLLVRLMQERHYDKDPVFDPDKVLFANEFGPESTKEVANEHALCRRYALEHGCHWEEGGTGHVHAHVYENFLKCGTVCIVGDSHTTVHGAYGCFATGCGSTDMVAVTRFGKTWIKSNVKIDNQVMIAHNVVIGESSILVAQCGIAGSAEIGRGVVLAAKAGVNGHITLGDGVQVAGTSGVVKSLPAGAIALGTPAESQREFMARFTLPSRFEKLNTKFKELTREVEELKAALKK